jgi:hypothetical protein
MFPEHVNPARPAHPGVVTFVGTDGVERTEPADRLPEWLAYAPDAGGDAVPVVRVVRLKTDRGTALRSYSADGRLLWVGLTVPTPDAIVPAPRPAAHPAPVGWF